MLALPRVGQEVMVEFTDADPDQPVVIGSVYNSNQPAPASLPEERTRFMIKSKTHQGTDFHGLMFDDLCSEPGVEFRSDGTYHFQAKDNVGHDYGGTYVQTHRNARISLVGGTPLIGPPSNALISSTGSGSGAGSSYVDQLSQMVPNSWADLEESATNPTVDLNLVTGAALEGTLGLDQNVIFGNFSRLTVDPTFSYLISALGIGSSVAGATVATLGHENTLHYGTRYTCHGGPVYNFYNQTVMSPLLAAYALLNVTQFFLTMGNPNYAGLTAAGVTELLKEIMILLMRVYTQANYAYNDALSLLDCITQGAANATAGNFQTAMGYFGQAGNMLSESAEVLLNFGLEDDGATQTLRVTGASHAIELGATDTYRVVKQNTQQNISLLDGYTALGTEKSTLTLGDAGGGFAGIDGAELTTTADGVIRFAKESYGNCGHTMLMGQDALELTCQNTSVAAPSGNFFNLNANPNGTTIVASQNLAIQTSTPVRSRATHGADQFGKWCSHADGYHDQYRVVGGNDAERRREH